MSGGPELQRDEFVNRITKNASWLIISKIVQMLLGLVISMMSARYLGPSNYGIINYASSIITFVSPFAMLGMGSIIVQELLDDPNNEGQIMGTMILSCTVSAIGGVAASIAFALVFNAGETETIVVVGLYSLILITQAWETLQFWFQSKLLSKYYAVVSLISYVVVSAYKIYLLATQKTVYWFAVSYALDYLLIAILLVFCYRREHGQRLSFSFARLRKMLSKSRYYIISTLMVTFCAQTDKIMINAMIDDVATGYYSAAAVCAGLASFVFGAVTDSFRPVILQNKALGQDRFENGVKKLYSLVIYMSLAISLGTTLLAKPLIWLTYGADYAPAIPILRIAVWYTCFSYLGIVRNIWILAEGLQRYLWVANLMGAVTNIALNALLIPVMGGCGAALASVVTQFVMNVGSCCILKPLRRNNRLLLGSFDPRLLVDMVKQLVRERKA